MGGSKAGVGSGVGCESGHRVWLEEPDGSREGRRWPLRRGPAEANVLDGVEWEEPGLRSGPTWTPLPWPLAGWPPAV